ncbi:UN93A-like protein [Mya arenaria]|uniref:UN93A-like protein n=1 Tax=Mya arenaria TaxID=6604 RepID=A0ABY7EXC4_MYAAR|nr:UN93A-like protein [Mya arenaria]
MADPDNGNASTEDTEADELLHGPPGNHLNRLCNSQPDSNPEPTFLLTQHERSDQLDVETGTSCAELSGVKAYTNLIVLTIALTLNFTAFNSFQALQSSLNIAEGLGTTGLSVLYATMVLTSLFFAQLTLVRFSNKWIMVISSLSYTAFMATGFYPAWSTVIPASLLIGFAFLISLAVMVSLLLWQPSREGLPIVFVLAGLYGLASAGNEPLLIMLHSTLFKDSTTAALSSYRAMSSLGWAVSFGYSNWLCMRHKLYIVITMLSLSYLCLSVLFLRHRTMANVCRKLTCTSLKRTDERDDIDT